MGKGDKIMKASTVIIIILAVIAVGVTVLWFTANSAKMQVTKQNDSIQTAFESALNTITEIQASLDSIDVRMEGKLLTKEEMPQTDEAGRMQMFDKIKTIRVKLEADRKRISDLEKKLARSNTQIKGLETLVANLKASLEEKEKMVAELSGQIGLYADSLSMERVHSKVALFQKEQIITKKDSLIDMQSKDLNTIYYAYGTRKELVEKGIIKRLGGFLGIGRVSVVQKAEPEKYFTWDLQDTNLMAFPVTTKGYTILTKQDETSFNVEQKILEGDKAENLMEVTNPELFRQNKYLVIELR
jgi:uncharacterized protein (DUF3084 family)